MSLLRDCSSHNGPAETTLGKNYGRRLPSAKGNEEKLLWTMQVRKTMD